MSDMIVINGEEISRSAYFPVKIALEKLVARKPDVATQLFWLVNMGDIGKMTEEAFTTLYQLNLIDERGEVDNITKSIAQYHLTLDDGNPVIRDYPISALKNEEASQVKAVVAGLSDDELVSIHMAIMLGGFGEHTEGYSKVSGFVENGKPTPVLTETIEIAVANRIG